MAMLDLTSIKKPTMEIKLSEDMTLHVLPASKSLIDEAMHIQRTPDALYDVVARILSNNREKITVERADIETLDLHDVMLILNTFVKFIVDMQNSPN